MDCSRDRPHPAESDHLRIPFQGERRHGLSRKRRREGCRSERRIRLDSPVFQRTNCPEIGVRFVLSRPESGPAELRRRVFGARSLVLKSVVPYESAADRIWARICSARSGGGELAVGGRSPLSLRIPSGVRWEVRFGLRRHKILGSGRVLYCSLGPFGDVLGKPTSQCAHMGSGATLMTLPAGARVPTPAGFRDSRTSCSFPHQM